MPLYEYINGSGATVELHRPVEERNDPVRIDGQIFVRASTVPDRIAIHGLGPTEDQEFDAKIRRAYHKKEEKEGSRFKSGFSKKQLARTWTNG